MTQKKEQLDKEESQILDDFEAGEFRRIRNVDGEKQVLEEAAAETLRKDKRINIRIASRDLDRIQKLAAREGIPYQTLISSTLHKLVTGRLKEMG